MSAFGFVGFILFLKYESHDIPAVLLSLTPTSCARPTLVVDDEVLDGCFHFQGDQINAVPQINAAEFWDYLS